MTKEKTKILLVEDDKNLGFIIKKFLSAKGYSIDLQTNGNDGLKIFLTNSYDLLILDIMLPLKDGFSLAADIRKKDKLIPIIFLTAKGLQKDRIKGFKIGADDYITKPFNTEELYLRIEAILRRSIFSNSQDEYKYLFQIGNYNFNYYNRTLNFNGTEKKLTKREADLFRLLCIYKNETLRRDIALKNIWGDDDYFMGRSMDVYITKLRKYLNKDSKISIKNIHGTGFKLEIKKHS